MLVRARLLIGDGWRVARDGGMAIDGGMAMAVAMAMKSGAMAIFASLRRYRDWRRTAERSGEGWWSPEAHSSA